MAKLERASFGSKLGIILATAGSAVGLGNVWRFPYMAGQNGGAVFIIIYIVCVLLLGIPCMISEFIIGRHAQSNTAHAYMKVGGKNPLSYIGYMSVFTGFLITGYYAVVSGWCLQYIWASAIGQLDGGNPEFFKSYFVNFSQHDLQGNACDYQVRNRTSASLPPRMSAAAAEIPAEPADRRPAS